MRKICLDTKICKQHARKLQPFNIPHAAARIRLHKSRGTALWTACKLLILKQIKSQDFY